MKYIKNKFAKALGTILLGCVLFVGSTNFAMADELSDAAAIVQQQLMAQQYQAALLAQQQQALLLQQYQAALAAQQQALLAQQYQAAVEIQNNFIKQHQDAAQQAFLLQQLQNMQYQQYQAMIQRCGLDYQSQLLEQYKKYQNEALKSFLGYNGY